MYYEHLGTNFIKYQGVLIFQVSLYDKPHHLGP